MISFILGSLLTFFVSWLFYKKSIRKKSITTSLDYFSKFFDKVDSRIKPDFVVQFKQKRIEHLFSAQFTIENTGNVAIRDIINPLTLTIPKQLEIIDVSITLVNPKGRDVKSNLTKEESTVSFNFPLLNQQEKFTFQILFSGDVLSYLEEKANFKDSSALKSDSRSTAIVERNIIDEFVFKITVDDIPPTLKIREGKKINGAKKFSLVDNVFYLIMGAAIIYVLYNYTFKTPSYFVFNFSEFFSKNPFIINEFDFLRVSLIISWMVALFLSLKGGLIVLVRTLKKINQLI